MGLLTHQCPTKTVIPTDFDRNITTWELLIFFEQKLFEDDISVIFDRFSSIKYLSITKKISKC